MIKKLEAWLHGLGDVRLGDADMSGLTEELLRYRPKTYRQDRTLGQHLKGWRYEPAVTMQMSRSYIAVFPDWDVAVFAPSVVECICAFHSLHQTISGALRRPIGYHYAQQPSLEYMAYKERLNWRLGSLLMSFVVAVAVNLTTILIGRAI